MDGLLIILAIFGLISSLNRKKKMQEAARKAQLRDNAFEEAFPGDQPLHPEVPAPKAAEPMAKIEKAVKKAVQQEIPFTKEEWDSFLGRIEGGKPAEKAAPKPLGEKRVAVRQPLAEGFSAPLRSVQGESDAEHKAHLEKIAAEEKIKSEQAEYLREIRSMNQKKLRQAIIMGEILGKPVALRKKQS